MPDTADRPNFILVVPDQHRGDCLGIDGHPSLLTPHLDALAAGGARFRRAYSTCPSCIPARRSLMTGQHPATSGVVGFQGGVPITAPTLPQVLRDHGYQTALIGRTMHQSPPLAHYGFEHMEMTSTGGPDSSRYSEALGAEGPLDHGITANGWTARPWHRDEALHEVYWTLSETIRWFHQHRDPTRPFFLVVGFVGPHPPLVPPAFYLERYLRMNLPEPAIGDWAEAPADRGYGLGVQSDQAHLTGEALRSCLAGYFGTINYIDDQLFRLLGGRGLPGGALANTVIGFTSDHGEMLGDHYLFRKCYPYEGSARIPFLLHGPRELGFAPGVVSDAPVCLEDLMPTFLELAGCDVPETVDGRSLVPLLRGAGDGAAPRALLHGEHATCYRPEQANHYLTDGRWKYIWYPHRGTEQLFDLAGDPGERHDLTVSPAHAERAAAWRRALIDRLADRPEGFTDGERLQPGTAHRAVMPHAPAGGA